MTTLDPALDKLRNKELSFGCVIENAGYIIQADDKGLAIIIGLPYWVGNRTVQMNAIDRDRIIGHPLTRGRICQLHHDLHTSHTIYNHLNIFEKHPNTLIEGAYYILANRNLFNKTEIERQQHPKRPELRELLIKFAEYI